jgi:hypothetical protein
MNYREIAKAIRDPENQPHQFLDADLAQFFVEAADEIERLREALKDINENMRQADRYFLKESTMAALKGVE